MLDDVYNTKILELAARTPGPARLEAPDATATRHSKLCGSKLTADIAVADERIADIAMEVKACALGQAAATVVFENAVGATFDEVIDARDRMHDMLKSGDRSPTGRFGELEFLSPVKDYRARHASTLLAIDALAEAFEAARVREAA